MVAAMRRLETELTRFLMPRQVVPEKKKRGPAPTEQGELLGVRLRRELMGPLDAWIADQPDPKPSRQGAIRTLLRAALIGSDVKD